MNPEIKQKWVAALRSGDYEQGSHFLLSHDGAFCCLGVLCDLYAKETKRSRFRPSTVSRNPWLFVDIDEDGETVGEEAELPLQVRRWAGLGAGSGSGAKVMIGGVDDWLTAHNDDHERTFAEIADAIEQQL